MSSGEKPGLVWGGGGGEGTDPGRRFVIVRWKLQGSAISSCYCQRPLSTLHCICLRGAPSLHLYPPSEKHTVNVAWRSIGTHLKVRFTIPVAHTFAGKIMLKQ